MKCTRCGAQMLDQLTDLPFKVGPTEIVVIRAVPVLQCANCIEYLIRDVEMTRIEAILGEHSPAAEIEVFRFAA